MHSTSRSNPGTRPLMFAAAVAAAAITTLTAAVPAHASGQNLTHVSPAHVLDVTARDYQFELSTHTVAAGLLTVRLHDTGTMPHQVVLAKLHPGQSEATYLAALQAGGPGAANSLVDFVGGANAILPGGYQVDSQNLDAGQYLTLCFLPGPDGVPHVAMGMIDTFSVVGHADTDNDADDTPRHVAGTITAIDFGYLMPARVDGDGTYKFVNATAADTHELGIVRLLPGKTVDDVKAWYANGESTPPPFIPAGGGGALSPGRSQWVRLNLIPGQYAAVCNIPDDMPPYLPHAAMGMITGFTVDSR